MEDTISTSENPSTCAQFSPATRIICRVCQKQFSQYTCPRCNTKYCSLHCYKSHSLRCTESFMRDNVVDELRQVRPDEESKKKMLEILKRFHAEDEEGDSMDEDEPTLSEETIQKVLSGDEITFDDLTAEEQKLFQRAMASGELSKMIEPWEPWWLNPCAQTISLSKDGTQLIQPIEGTSTSSNDNIESNPKRVIPSGPEEPLSPLSKLTSAQPSPLLAFHLIDILYSYCFTLRLYNGDWQSDPSGASMVVLSVSSVLGQTSQPESILEAVSYCLEQTCSPAFRHTGGLQFGFTVVDDVASLISLGGSALVCALCDLQRMFRAAEKEMKLERLGKAKRAEMKSKMKGAERKVYFIMCWVHEQPEEAWASLSVLVKAEKASAMEYQNNRFLKKDKADNKSKVLIEEV